MRSLFSARAHHFQDLSLAPSDDCAATPLADDQPSAGVASDCLADDNAYDAASPALPAALGEQGSMAFDGSSAEHTPAVDPGQDDAPHNVLSPAASMSLFSPSADATLIESPSAASSYAQAAEALGHDNSVASILASPVAPLACGGGVHQGGGHAERQEQQHDNMLRESDGSAR